MKTKIGLSIVILALALLTSCSHQKDAGISKLNFVLRDVDGRQVKLSDYKGKVVILDFWDTWCPPCEKEIPGFINLYSQYKDKGFQMVGIALARKGVAAVKDYINEKEVNYPVLIATNELLRAYGCCRGIPTTYVLNKKGEIYRTYVGYRDESIFKKDIRNLLNLEG